MMLQRFFAGLALVLATPLAAVSEPLSIEFLPPDIAPRDLCNAPITTEVEVTTEQGLGKLELTDAERIEYITRDIRRLQRDDADRWFDFIDALIDWRARIDPEFAGIDEALARVTLHLRADRMGALRARNLIPQLRLRAAEMTNNQRLTLARYYRDGIGVSADDAFAQEMLREAAFGGNARALTEIARLQLRGEYLEGWDAPLDLTVTMAFGGLLGELNPGVCKRAERIAQEYLKGELVTRNTAIASAWRRFAADMGDAQAAWRVVEYHLNAEAERKDIDEMRHYLRRAAALGIAPDLREHGAILASGLIPAEEIEAILGVNHSENRRRVERPLTPFIEMGLRINGRVVNEDSLRLQYLREQAQMPSAPGFVFTALAEEVMARKGRWRAEAEAMDLLEEAVRRGDEKGMQRLAGLLIRYRDDPQRINRAENLLIETVDRFGMVSSMRRLDALYRCQRNDAPRMEDANFWLSNFKAAGAEPVAGSATDILTLSPFRTPEMLARIQTQALEGNTQARAEFAQRLQSDPLSHERALRIWADRVARSDKALENFGRMQLDLATSAAEWDLAVEFFRRVYLNNGVTTALDLAVALIEDNGRDPLVAAEIDELLTIAGMRGEGAAIRLKSRALARSAASEDQLASAEAVYEEFAEVIEQRGDFLALMFAIPFLPEHRVDDYMDRAVSLMNCGNKDADEVGDAYALRGDVPMSHHWREVILGFEGGHILSKLRLSNERMEMIGSGRAPDAVEVIARRKEDGVPATRTRLYALTGNPDLPGYDPGVAAGHLLAMLEQAGPEELRWVLNAYRIADDAVRIAVADKTDITAVFRAAAEAGDATAQYEYAMLLRRDARGRETLGEVVDWLRKSAERGHDEAMVELAFATGFALGVPRDVADALEWLRRADAAGNPRAADLARLLSATEGQ